MAEADELRAAAREKLALGDKLLDGKTDVEDSVREEADGFYAEAGELGERAQTAEKRAKLARSVEADERQADADRERAARERGRDFRERAQGDGGVQTGDLQAMPTVAQLRERSAEAAKRRAGLDHREDVALRSWPVEDLFVPMLRREFKGERVARRMGLRDEHVEAWDEYVGLSERALTPTTDSGTAGAGLELVPENLANRIAAQMKMIGGFADLGGVSRFVQDNPGPFLVPTESRVTDTGGAAASATNFTPERTAEGADSRFRSAQTGRKTIPLERFDVATVLTDEQLMSGNISLEAFLVQNIGRQFGALTNRLITVGKGSGSNEPIGAATVAGRKTDVDTARVIAEADVKELFQNIDGHYVSMSDSILHAHFSTIIEMATLRESAGGNLVFDRTVDGLGVVALGKRVMPNNALTVFSTNGAGHPIMLAGDPTEYVWVTDGPMRFERDREARSGQWVIYWRQMMGGAPRVDEAFRWLATIA